jgi:hypothetical protein
MSSPDRFSVHAARERATSLVHHVLTSFRSDGELDAQSLRGLLEDLRDPTAIECYQLAAFAAAAVRWASQQTGIDEAEILQLLSDPDE